MQWILGDYFWIQKKELSDVREIGDYVKVTPTKFDRVFIIQLLELSVETAFRIIADGNGERLSSVLWILDHIHDNLYIECSNWTKSLQNR